MNKITKGPIQVLHYQRGGWVGWPNDDVIRKYTRKKLYLRAQRKRMEFSLKKPFFYVVTFL